MSSSALYRPFLDTGANRTFQCRMSKVSDSYKWEDMCDLTEEDMDNLLLFYPANKVPAMDILKALRGGHDVETLDAFEGSFGFSVGS